MIAETEGLKQYDTIVIGAGLGGLVAAAYLAREGQKVLVIEQNHLLGGCASTFRRPGYEFEIGLHYMSDSGFGGGISGILDDLHIKDQIELLPLDPDGFLTFIFPEMEIAVPVGFENYRQKLTDMFPDEKAGIDYLFRFLEQVDHFMKMTGSPSDFIKSTIFDPFSDALKLFSIVTKDNLLLRYKNAPLSVLLDRVTKNQKLRAIICAHHSNYGLPSTKVSAIVHGAIMVGALRNGVYYPKGGANTIISLLEDVIKQHGGSILLQTNVEKIQVKNNCVTGVIAKNKERGSFAINCSNVISNADIKRTYCDLLGPDCIDSSEINKVSNYKMPYPLFSVYLGARIAKEELKLRNSAYYYIPTEDIDSIYKEIENGNIPDNPYVLVSSSTIKDPQNSRTAPDGCVNLELITLAPPYPSSWGVTEKQVNDSTYSNSEEYKKRKKIFTDRIISSAEHIIPNLRDIITFQETGSPLTHFRYMKSTWGTSYGIGCTPEQFGKKRPGAKTSIRGLYLAGASTRSVHGIAGSMRSGSSAAAAVLYN